MEIGKTADDPIIEVLPREDPVPREEPAPARERELEPELEPAEAP